MKFLYLEAVGGASGDMLLGAFLDDLVPFEHLKNEIARLSLKNYKLELSETQKQHISASLPSEVTNIPTGTFPTLRI